MKRLAGYTAVVIATLALLLLLWQFHEVLLLFVLSLLAAAAVRPIIARLVKRGLPLPLAMLLTYITGLGIIVLLLYIISDSLFAEAQAIANNFAVAYEVYHLRWADEGSGLQYTIATRLPPPEQFYAAITGSQGELLAQRIFGATVSLFSFIGGFLMTLLLSIYWSADQDHFERLWLSLLPATQRARARDMWRAMETEVGAYLRSEFTQSFMAALLLGLGYWLAGLAYPTLLALIGAIAWLIPLVGFIFIAIPVFLVGLSHSLTLAIAVTLYTLSVLLLLEFVVEPRIFNRRRNISPLLVVLVMIPLLDAYGIPGLIVAPLLAVTVQIFFTYSLNRQAVPTFRNTTEQVTQLETRLAHVRAMFEERDEPPPPEVINLMERLSSLIQAASQALPAEKTAESKALTQPGVRQLPG
jgi:predicted PurR-regulated permease PerM